MANAYQALAQGEVDHTRRYQYEQQTLDAYKQAAKIAPSSITQLKAKLNQLDFLLSKEEWSSSKEEWLSSKEEWTEAEWTEVESIWRSLYPQIANTKSALDRDHIYAKINYAQNLVDILALDNSTIPQDLKPLPKLTLNGLLN